MSAPLWKSFVLAAVATLVAGATHAATATPDEPNQDITYKTSQLFAQGAYRFMVEQKFAKSPDDTEPLDMEQTLIVLKDGREIHRREGWRWEVDGTPDLPDARYVAPKPGSDITGDGIPDVVLRDYSGGAHCCSTYYVFELRDSLPVHQLVAGDHAALFKQMDDRPALEVELSDDNYAYWRSSFIDSAAPKVVLRYRAQAYEIAPDLMRAPPPSQADMAQWAEESRADYGWKMETKPRGADDASDLGGVFLDKVTQLIYQGHADLVQTFVDLAWPSAKPGKDAFVAELMECRIRNSDYWPAVAALNGLPADPPIGRCD